MIADESVVRQADEKLPEMGACRGVAPAAQDGVTAAPGARRGPLLSANPQMGD